MQCTICDETCVVSMLNLVVCISGHLYANMLRIKGLKDYRSRGRGLRMMLGKFCKWILSGRLGFIMEMPFTAYTPMLSACCSFRIYAGSEHALSPMLSESRNPNLRPALCSVGIHAEPRNPGFRDADKRVGKGRFFALRNTQNNSDSLCFVPNGLRSDGFKLYTGCTLCHFFISDS